MTELAILGFRPGIYRAIISKTELKDKTKVDVSDVKILKAYEISHNFEELKKVLTEIHNDGYKIKRYLVGYEGEIAYGNFKDEFDDTKHSNLIIKHLKNLKKKKDKEMEEVLNNLKNKYEVINGAEDIKKMYSDLVEIAERFFPMLKEIHQAIIPATDRDYLDINIEIYNMLFSKLKGLEYGREKSEKLLEDDFMKKLLKYKMQNYGREILGSLGMELVGETKDGFIIREEMPKHFN